MGDFEPMISPLQARQMIERLQKVGHRAPPVDAVPLESTLHRDIMDYCEKQWPVWIYVHSRIDRATRLESGVPDFFVLAPAGRLLIIECKAKGNKQTTAQLSWAARARMLGHVVYLVHNFREFLEVVK